MKIRTVLLTLAFFCGSFLPTLLQASSAWPDQGCGDSPYWLTFSEMELCIAKSKVEYLNHLNLSSPSLQITFNSSEAVMSELLVNVLDPHKATGGLHTQLDFTVKELFLNIFANNMQSSENAALFNTVMTIDADTTLLHFTKNNLDAFVILRGPDLWDEVFIMKEEREVIIQMAGEFDFSQVEWLLARVRWGD